MGLILLEDPHICHTLYSVHDEIVAYPWIYQERS